jgi:hypothetical protein
MSFGKPPAYAYACTKVVGLDPLFNSSTHVRMFCTHTLIAWKTHSLARGVFRGHQKGSAPHWRDLLQGRYFEAGWEIDVE